MSLNLVGMPGMEGKAEYGSSSSCSKGTWTFDKQNLQFTVSIKRMNSTAPREKWPFIVLLANLLEHSSRRVVQSHTSFHESWLRTFDEASKVCIACPFRSLLFTLYFFASWTAHSPVAPLASWSRLHRPVSCPCFIYFFAGCCVITLFIYLNDFAVLKNHKSKQKSHLKDLYACKNQQAKSDACLLHELCACDSAVSHGSITHFFFPQDPAPSLAQDVTLPAMLHYCRHQTFLILPLSSWSCCLSADLAFTPPPASLTPYLHLCALHFIAAPAPLHPPSQPGRPPLPPGATRLLHLLPTWDILDSLSLALVAFSLQLLSLQGPSHGGCPLLAGSGDSSSGELQHLSWPPKGKLHFVLWCLGPGCPARSSLAH